MSDALQSRVLAIMGSGETSPTMVTVHKDLVARLGAGAHRAVLLDTPYAFQENAGDISTRSQAYFARSVGLKVEVLQDAELAKARGADPAAARAAEDTAVAAIRSYDWVFAGPGSPTYALARWQRGPVPAALRDRIAAGSGITVIASAAAAAMGYLAVPVYEIYKVGADPHWLSGLDLMSVLGLKVAVIPHYDNAEGGTHDTRFCYLGERRLAALEPELAADAAVLGVDEHTALVIDLATGQAKVLGRGGVTVRKAGLSTVLQAGTRIALPDLRILVRSGGQPAGYASSPGSRSEPAPAASQAAGDAAGGAAAPGPGDTAGGATGAGHAGQASSTGLSSQPAADLPDITRDAQQRFDAAARHRDSAAMVSAILDLEAAIEAWSTDTDENDNAERARAVLRGLIVRLGRVAQDGLADPADRLRPAIDPLVAVRASLRTDGHYAAADAIRDALTAAGIEVRDAPGGAKWTVGPAISRGS